MLLTLRSNLILKIQTLHFWLKTLNQNVISLIYLQWSPINNRVLILGKPCQVVIMKMKCASKSAHDRRDEGKHEYVHHGKSIMPMLQSPWDAPDSFCSNDVGPSDAYFKISDFWTPVKGGRIQIFHIHRYVEI